MEFSGFKWRDLRSAVLKNPHVRDILRLLKRPLQLPQKFIRIFEGFVNLDNLDNYLFQEIKIIFKTIYILLLFILKNDLEKKIFNLLFRNYLHSNPILKKILGIEKSLTVRAK